MYLCADHEYRLTSPRNSRGISLVRIGPLCLSKAFSPDFALADRILMPAFSTMNVHNMFDDMVDVIGQLCDKWARHVISSSLATVRSDAAHTQIRPALQDRTSAGFHVAHAGSTVLVCHVLPVSSMLPQRRWNESNVGICGRMNCFYKASVLGTMLRGLCTDCSTGRSSPLRCLHGGFPLRVWLAIQTSWNRKAIYARLQCEV